MVSVARNSFPLLISFRLEIAPFSAIPIRKLSVLNSAIFFVFVQEEIRKMDKTISTESFFIHEQFKMLVSVSNIKNFMATSEKTGLIILPFSLYFLDLLKS
jgi:hypothetical protein